MHLEVYRQRPDASAVVHAHPPIATGFAVAGIPLDRAVLAEVVTTLGSVPIAEYATPSTKELPEAVRKYVKAHDGMLLANHGALTLGADLFARVLQDGDDRALRAHQPGGAAARRRAAAVARRKSIGCRGCAACTASRRRRRFVRCPRSRGPRLAREGDPGEPARPFLRRKPTAPGSFPTSADAVGQDGEIRLTYRELTALIEAAVREIK